MCGRYTNTVSIKKLAERFGFPTVRGDFPPRYNIAPGQTAPVVLKSSPRRLAMMRWGLVPHWAKDPKTGYKMINARAETLGEKPSFKRPFQSQRCLVVADGFYEWRKSPGKKTKVPFHISLKNREPFAFAGLWDRWEDPSGKELVTFTIITTDANELLRPIHDRMPVILPPDQEALWLDRDCHDLKKLSTLLLPYPEGAMAFHAVSTLVNSPKMDRPECIAPLKISSPL